MKKGEYFDMYFNAMSTNFMVEERKEAVLNRPVVIATKTHYYHKGEIIDNKLIPANCVIIKAGQYNIPVWLLSKESDGKIHLMCGYLNTYRTPVKSSQIKTKLKDYFIEDTRFSKIINLNAKNPSTDLYALKYDGKDLRFSVFSKTYSFFCDFKNEKCSTKRHLQYEEPVYTENILHPATLKILFENGVQEELLDSFTIKEKNKYKYYYLRQSKDQPIETKYLNKGLYSYLLHHTIKESHFPQEIEKPTDLISEYKGSIIIYDDSEESVYYFYKHSILEYQKNVDTYTYRGRKDVTIGTIIQYLWNNDNQYINHSVDELYNIIVTSLPLIYNIGNYKYTLGHFIQITNWINLPISNVLKLFVIIKLLEKHPNDHYFEMWLKYQLSTKTSLEWIDFLTIQFKNIELYGLRWYTRNYSRWDYKTHNYVLASYPTTPQDWLTWIIVLWSRENTMDSQIYPELNKYLKFPHLMDYYNTRLLSPTWGYKNLQNQLHMSFSMFKGFLKEKPFKEDSEALINWDNFINTYKNTFLDWEETKEPQIIKKISSLSYEQYQIISSPCDFTQYYEASWMLINLFRFVYGRDRKMDTESLCKAILLFNKHNKELKLNLLDEYIRQVSTPNSLLQHIECPKLLSQCNYNYISNWTRREDVIHLVEMLDRSISDSCVTWQSKFEDLRNNKHSLSTYLSILHDFYFQVDNSLHQQIILAKEAELNKKFINVSSELEKYIYSDDKLLIRPPKDIKELQNEGQILHHCVFGFREKMANKQSFIFFIRNKTSETIPYYTVELVNGPEKFIRQVHGNHNSQPTPEIVEFLKSWVKKFKFNPEVKDYYSALG